MSGWVRSVVGRECPECKSDGPHTEFGEPVHGEYPRVLLEFECGACAHEWVEDQEIL